MRGYYPPLPAVAAVKIIGMGSLSRVYFSFLPPSLSLSFAFIFLTFAHCLAYDTMHHLRLSAFSARAESWRRTSKRCFASMTTLASQSQASPRMHAFSGLSCPISLFYELAGLLRHEPFSLCMRAYSNFMRQQAMASKMVFNRPVPVNRLVSTIADSTSFLSHTLDVLPSREREGSSASS